ncbi:MAG: DUF72 domain-containing protein [Ignavibacteria bacterium CG_4_8_14_3_um_filter_37_9]|nr:MAG: hypothetical protein AUJ54_10630 [Ignavibacteria bacterium CG1_02_37_35]PIW98496.1 MAG: DUF72 domain-containing protein [Ignavibacteria bacterium CG_4_8_14_3_um_filter_37_9]
MAIFRIGTCSWKYDSWKGIIYSAKAEQNYLDEYSKHFNTVEIDQWFWSLLSEKRIILPKETDVKLYADSVPDDFKFTIKIPNSITLTHFYRKNNAEPLKENPHFLDTGLFNSFTDSLKSMSDKIGVLMFQFEYLNKQKMSGLDEFIERVEPFFQSLDSTHTYGVELRNPNYLKKPFFDLLERNNLSMVFLQGYFMPNIWQTFEEHKDHLSTTVVIRLHGGDRAGMEEKTNKVWNKIVEPKDEDIEKVRRMIYSLRRKEVDLYVNVNNHYEGSAPLTIEKIKRQGE